MEDKTIKKLNIPAADLPEVKRTVDGKIDLEAITIEIDEKNNKIIPDDIFDNYYRELPNGVINQSKTWRTASGGKLKILSSDDIEIQRAGGEALQATLKQRRSIQETVKIMLAQKATAEEIEAYNLPEDATKQDAMMAAMMVQAIERGNIQAGIFIRDTAGEKPTEKIAAEVETITAEDRERIERILNRDKTAE